MKRILFMTFLAIQLVACGPEIGSEKWCENLEDKPKGDWTANEAVDYTKHCIF